jgi:hypothetical protein
MNPEQIPWSKYAKIVEMKLLSCGLEIVDIRKIAFAELRLWSNISLKSYGIAIAEVLPSSCGIAIEDSKKKLRVPTSGGCFQQPAAGRD